MPFKGDLNLTWYIITVCKVRCGHEHLLVGTEVCLGVLRHLSHLSWFDWLV